MKQILTSIRMKPKPLFVILLCFVCCSEEEPENLPVFSITGLVVTGKTVYASTEADGLFFLQEGKDSWQRSDTFHFNPLIAVSETTAYAVQGGYIHRLDKGNTEPWVDISTSHGWGNEVIWSLLVVGDTIYAGMGNGRVYRATGRERLSWVAVANAAISSLAIFGTSLYAGSGEYPHSSEGEGVFRSLDGGDSWTPVNTGLAEQNVTSLAVTGTTVYAGTRDGVFRLEHDESWTHVGLSGAAVASLVAESGTNRLYAGTWADGVFRSPSGVSWQYWGLAGLPIRALAVSEKYLYAGTFGRPLTLGRAGIFRKTTVPNTPEGFGLWTPINQGLTKITN